MIQPLEKEVRVRIAPSPTGDWHLGNARTALFNFLFARKHEGNFFLRIEDTDQGRLVEGAVERLIGLMEWLGWVPDLYDSQAFVRQSERLDLYQEVVEKLLAEGHAYYCFATSEELEVMRAEQEANKQAPRYDNRWGYRDLPLAEAQKRVEAGKKAVVRFKMPLEGETVTTDALRGEVRVENRLLDDHVILKSDGFPTYHLAHVVDDHIMGISHVIRGDEWLASTPRHVQLHTALGWKTPVYIHAPVILGPDKGKLSKRHGAKPVIAYRDEGYLPEALTNYLALLGWSSGTDETFFTLEELFKRFDVSGMQKSPAVFDAQKLDWYNASYIRKLTVSELTTRIYTYYAEIDLTGVGAGWVERIDANRDFTEHVVASLQERLVTLADFAELAAFYWESPQNYNIQMLPTKKQTLTEAAALLETVLPVLEAHQDWSHDGIESLLRQFAEAHGVKPGDILWPLRVALTGLPASPSTFDVLAILGRDESLKRIRYALSLAYEANA